MSAPLSAVCKAPATLASVNLPAQPERRSLWGAQRICPGLYDADGTRHARRFGPCTWQTLRTSVRSPSGRVTLGELTEALEHADFDGVVLNADAEQFVAEGRFDQLPNGSTVECAAYVECDEGREALVLARPSATDLCKLMLSADQKMIVAGLPGTDRHALLGVYARALRDYLESDAFAARVCPTTDTW